MIAAREIAPAKINLALHVRRKRPDGRHDIETVFAFCTDGDRLSAEPSDRLSLTVTGPFAAQLAAPEDNLVIKAGEALASAAGVQSGAAITLDKKVPVASGIGGGSADAAAALRLLTSLWRIDRAHAQSVAPKLGMPRRGTPESGDSAAIFSSGVINERMLAMRCCAGSAGSWNGYVAAWAATAVPSAAASSAARATAAEKFVCMDVSIRRRVLLSAGWLNPNVSAALPRFRCSATATKYSKSRKFSIITIIHEAMKSG